MNFTLLLIQFVNTLATALTYLIFIRAILSWFPISRDNFLVELLFQLTEPVLSPLRRVIPTFGMIDLSPLVAILLLQLLPVMVERIFAPYYGL